MPSAPQNGLEHRALLYAGAAEYVAGIKEFVEGGLDRGEPVLIAVPGQRLETLRSALPEHRQHIEFVDMRELGRNPSRIIPAVRHWWESHGGRRCLIIGEPIWPERGRRETVEATRHEALLNFAFADCAISILCPYGTGGLDRQAIADAHRTHPELGHGGEYAASVGYADPMSIWNSTEWALPEPRADVATTSVGEDLAALRRFVESYSSRVGLAEPRRGDLVLAANEVATNALRYTDSPGELRMWRDGDLVVCEIADRGRLEDPLAGRRRPQPDCISGRGLWLVNEVCDLVEMRPGEDGTTVRLHVELAS